MSNLKRTSTDNGFSLIELLIVVAIVGILAIIALPSYNSYVISTNRVDSKRTLLSAAQALQSCFFNTNDYSHASCDDAIPTTSEDGFYTISISNRTKFTYTLTATPVGSQAHDEDCATLTLDNTSAEGATGNNPDKCWD